MRILIPAAVFVGAAFAVWWVETRPPAYHVSAPAYDIGPPPAAVSAVQSTGDWLAGAVTRTAPALPGYDDVVLQEDRGRAFASAIDGWIWEIDLATGASVRFADPPLMPAGMRAVPGDPDRILFCAAHYGVGTDPPDETPGVYELTISTGAIRPVAVRVPLPPPPAPAPDGNEGTIFTGAAATDAYAERAAAPGTRADGPSASAAGKSVAAAAALDELARDAMTDANSRPVAFCNDLDVSADGERIYFSEPFAYAGASMGPGAVAEAITLARNGLLWRVDRGRGTVALVAQGYTFLDGVLIEPDPTGAPERSILVTETPKFRILRLHLAGEHAGRDEILWQFLPGMPDGMDRDAAGRIWVGMVRMRSGLITWVHGHPWIKPFLLRLPLAALPVEPETALLALSPDAATPLFFTRHDGSRVQEISVVVPGRDRLYLPSFAADNHGLASAPYPPGLAPRDVASARPASF